MAITAQALAQLLFLRLAMATSSSDEDGWTFVGLAPASSQGEPYGPVAQPSLASPQGVPKTPYRVASLNISASAPNYGVVTSAARLPNAIEGLSQPPKQAPPVQAKEPPLVAPVHLETNPGLLFTPAKPPPPVLPFHYYPNPQEAPYKPPPPKLNQGLNKPPSTAFPQQEVTTPAKSPPPKHLWPVPPTP